MTSESTQTVLIVEDEEALADMYQHYLSTEYETIVAYNGGEALTALGPDIDVVLLDRRMPGMAGDDVLKRIEEWNLDFRTVIVSAVDPDMDIIDMPFDGYLTKSVSKAELLDAVNRMIKKDRYESLLAEYNSVAETYDVLKGHYSTSELSDDEQFKELESRVEELQDEIEAIVDGFEESSITNIFD